MIPIPPGGYKYTVEGHTLRGHDFPSLLEKVYEFYDRLDLPTQGLCDKVAQSLGLEHCPECKEEPKPHQELPPFDVLRRFKGDLSAGLPRDLTPCETCPKKAFIGESPDADLFLRKVSLLTGVLVPAPFVCGVCRLPFELLEASSDLSPYKVEDETLPHGCPIKSCTSTQTNSTPSSQHAA